MRKLHDRYFKQAKREGRLARSVYKLEEIDRRHRLLRRGDKVLDLGACPGSWLDYILEKIGMDGVACAVDRKTIDRKFKERVHFIKTDFTTLAPDAFGAWVDRFDAVVSDMAPNTSGIRLVDQARSLELCEAAFAYAQKTLRKGGHFVCKLFDGPEATAFRDRLAREFREVKMMKPRACREESFEFYLVALGHQGAAPAASGTASPAPSSDA